MMRIQHLWVYVCKVHRRSPDPSAAALAALRSPLKIGGTLKGPMLTHISYCRWGEKTRKIELQMSVCGLRIRIQVTQKDRFWIATLILSIKGIHICPLNVVNKG